MKTYLIAAAMGCAVLAAPLAAQEPAAIVTKSGTIGKPEAGKGLIVFWRPGTLVGAALGCTVHEGDKVLARLGSGKYYTVTAEPGKHVYNTEGEVKDVLNMEIEPDETYFVKCKIGMGIMAGRPNVAPSDAAEFGKKAKGMTMWKGPKEEK
ncbi:hypothetical protein [Sphingomonas immobilis]|uniref:DUF2846 domain-containing protein n=1 Tax=Sphingomonas immobilis TaxID=3063997 RepID=A0ABT8ZUU2_9SPHN|nr:hypothetical protein [Sphingomonas sp. CA1-15]MDO7840977.1 hypothetical protein [Sphingomonas sp. CA1-15]